MHVVAAIGLILGTHFWLKDLFKASVKPSTMSVSATNLAWTWRSIFSLHLTQTSISILQQTHLRVFKVQEQAALKYLAAMSMPKAHAHHSSLKLAIQLLSHVTAQQMRVCRE